MRHTTVTVAVGLEYPQHAELRLDGERLIFGPLDEIEAIADYLREPTPDGERSLDALRTGRVHAASAPYHPRRRLHREC